MDTHNESQYDAVYQSAMKQIEQEWLQVGMTQEELERNKRIADCIDTLAPDTLGAGPISSSNAYAQPAESSAETFPSPKKRRGKRYKVNQL